MIFIKLSNALRIQTSIEFNIEMSADMDADKQAAYNVGSYSLTFKQRVVGIGGIGRKRKYICSRNGWLG
jgi:hypothetical protein